jgi:hypothetical protein
LVNVKERSSLRKEEPSLQIGVMYQTRTGCSQQARSYHRTIQSLVKSADDHQNHTHLCAKSRHNAPPELYHVCAKRQTQCTAVASGRRHSYNYGANERPTIPFLTAIIACWLHQRREWGSAVHIARKGRSKFEDRVDV